MASVIDALSDFLDSEGVSVKFNSQNKIPRFVDDLSYRSFILGISIYKLGIGRLKKTSITSLKLCCFIVLNPRFKKELSRLVERKMNAVHLGDVIATLPEGFRADTVFDDVLRMLFISNYFIYLNDDKIELTREGLLFIDEIKKIESEMSDNFEGEMKSIEFFKRTNISKALIKKL